MTGQSIGEIDPTQFSHFEAVSLTVEGHLDRASDRIDVNNRPKDPVEEPTAVVVLKVDNRISDAERGSKEALNFGFVSSSDLVEAAVDRLHPLIGGCDDMQDKPIISEAGDVTLSEYSR
jgi:hypothetical protein